MRDSTQHLLQRLSLWVLGQALPETGALRAPARLAMMSVVVAAAAGTLLSLGIVAGLIGLYLYLVQEGLSVGASLSLVSALGILAGLLVYLIARRTVDHIPDQLDELKLFSAHSGDFIGNAFNLVIGGFLEGMAEKPETKATTTSKRTRAEIEAVIAELMDQINALEEDTIETEVVLEMKTPRGRK